MVGSFVQQAIGLERPPVTARADLPVTVDLAARLTALQAAKWLAGSRESDTREVFTLDTLTLRAERHPLPRRPQCPDCGTPGLQAERTRRPVLLSGRPKATTSDGGHRAQDPEQFLATYGHLISPVSGVVSALTKQPTGAGSGLHSYLAGHNFALQTSSLRGVRAGLRSQSAGKGMSDLQARASALAEAVERYSGAYQGDEERITASYRDLGGTALHPNALQLYSDRQYRERAEWNARDSHFHRVSDPFDESAPLEWTPVWSLTEGRHKYVPTSYLYYQYPTEPGAAYAWADSNGNAAGSSLEDAIVQGFMELVERDSVAIWWYNRLQRPAIDLDSFDEPYFTRWQETYRSLDRETWVLDLTSDLGIPVAAAISRRTDKPAEDILMAFGAHFDLRIAVSRALTEMNQFLPAVLPMRSDGSGQYAFDDPDQLRWWRTATVTNQPYLRPLHTAPARTAADHPYRPQPDLLDDVRLIQRTVEDRGMELLVLDQTRADLGLPVVKVIVPGMRHFWPRHAAGRLFDVPVQQGWLAASTSEEDLNPIGMFL
jgi:ribosomal protein S12 methylthiotransferase accessory factor